MQVSLFIYLFIFFNYNIYIFFKCSLVIVSELWTFPCVIGILYDNFYWSWESISKSVVYIDLIP